MQSLSTVAISFILGCNHQVANAPTSQDEISVKPDSKDLPIPLLRRLHEIGDLIHSRFPAKFDRGMGQLGLLLSRELMNGGYWCTPINTLEFGSTGGDGVHFSLVETDGKVSENSPVVMTVPANIGEPQVANVIVGRSLLDFVRFGLIRGYFAMEQFVYQRDLTLQAYSSADWQPKEKSHFSVGFAVDEAQQKTMHLVASELNITPLTYTPTEFELLQKQFMPMLQFKPS